MSQAVTTVVVDMPGLPQIVQVSGQQGPPGPPGVASQLLSLVLTGTVPGGSAVAFGGVVADIAAPDLFLGVATQGGIAGATILVAFVGLVTLSEWAWTPQQPVFLGAAGVLTQTAPTTGLSFVIGYALSSTSLNLQPFVPVQL